METILRFDAGFDARRKIGVTLKEMKDRGELAEKGKVNQHSLSQGAITTLTDLGLTLSQSSRYQKESAVTARSPRSRRHADLGGF